MPSLGHLTRYFSVTMPNRSEACYLTYLIICYMQTISFCTSDLHSVQGDDFRTNFFSFLRNDQRSSEFYINCDDFFLSFFQEKIITSSNNYRNCSFEHMIAFIFPIKKEESLRKKSISSFESEIWYLDFQAFKLHWSDYLNST